MKIKKGDNVMVILGKDRGRSGLVERALPKRDKAVITGINMHKHHLKPSRKNPHGGIMNIPAPIEISNVMVVCPHCSRPTRVAYKITETTKERICRKCKANLDVNAANTGQKEKNAK